MPSSRRATAVTVEQGELSGLQDRHRLQQAAPDAAGAASTQEKTVAELQALTRRLSCRRRSRPCPTAISASPKQTWRPCRPNWAPLTHRPPQHRGCWLSTERSRRDDGLPDSGTAMASDRRWLPDLSWFVHFSPPLPERPPRGPRPSAAYREECFFALGFNVGSRTGPAGGGR